MDALIVDKKKYHKSCFRCEHCRNRLSVGNYVSLHGHFYCLHHYKQLLKSKGNYDNGLVQQTSLGSGGPSDEWRYSTGSLSSVDKHKSRSYENVATKSSDQNKPHGSKISVVWPPQADHPKKSFKVEDDIQVTKPQWPPPDNAPESPTLQHRKAVPRSVL